MSNENRTAKIMILSRNRNDRKQKPTGPKLLQTKRSFQKFDMLIKRWEKNLKKIKILSTSCFCLNAYKVEILGQSIQPLSKSKVVA